VQKVLAPRGGHLLAALFLFDASLPVRGPCARAAAAVSAPVLPAPSTRGLGIFEDSARSTLVTRGVNDLSSAVEILKNSVALPNFIH